MRLTDHHRRRRLLLAAAAFLVLTPPRDVGALPCWRPPVDAPVTDPYREPACRWCPGNRGIEYGTRPGVTVRAVATGRVSYAGLIAGRGYVVVRHADGLRATYGGLRDTLSDPGDVVIRGAIVGTTSGPLHFGLRDGDRYVDPTPFFGRLVGRVRLVPVDRTPPRTVRPVLRCRPRRRPAGRVANPHRPARLADRPIDRWTVHTIQPPGPHSGRLGRQGRVR